MLNALEEALGRWARIWCLRSQAPTIRYEITERLSRSLGRCKQRTAVIRLNGILLKRQNRPLLFQTLCHEAAHVAAYYLYGSQAKPHGPEWKSLVKAAGYEPYTTIKAANIVGLKPMPRRVRLHYRYHCPICQTVHFAPLRTSRVRCRACVDMGRSGLLTVTRVT